MKAIKATATVITMAAIVLTSSGFTTPANVTEHGDTATITVVSSGGRLG